MQHVWFLFKFLEVIMGCVCLSFHIISLDELEPLPHVVFYCGTFFGYTMISFFGTIGILLGRGPKPFMEAITNGLAATMFTLASMLSMYHAENDYHLMYLSDFEEPLHKYFYHCKSQSIASLAGAFLYLLHSMYAFDVVCITKRQVNIFEDEHEEARQPIRLYFISESIELYLEGFSWFRRYSIGDLSKTSDYSLPTQHRRSRRKRKSSGLAISGKSKINLAISPMGKDNHLRGGFCDDPIQSTEITEIV